MKLEAHFFGLCCRFGCCSNNTRRDFMNDFIQAKDVFWESFEVIRFLQQEGSNSTSNATNSTGEELIPPNDGQVLRDTMKVYGSIFAVCFFLFCGLRKKYPKVSSSSNDHS
jgi:hypothetical protein